ncbi:MAG: septal ring lytic transglycosylase RlpA family protein [Clostridia bacterium]|nr:septal ring lytic transglycosylase RlpA family protein [Clostridia bacterium]
MLLFVLLPQVGQAAETLAEVEDFSMKIANQNYKFVQPILKARETGAIYVPARSFLKVLGVELEWNDKDKSVTLLADEKEYLVDLDWPNQQVNLSEKTYPIKVINSHTYIPLSLVLEILNFQFVWDDTNTTLYATKIGNTEEIIKNLPQAPEYKVVDTFTGIASWYGGKFHGRKTNSGEIFDENALTAAHRTLPFNTLVRVTFLHTNKSTIVRINDRGPHVPGRILDLSKAAAEEIGLKAHGLGKVKVEVLEKR